MSTPTQEQPKPAPLFPPAPEPKSKLGYYRLLSPTCGLRVSPICLGAMNFGTAWKEFMGEMTKETAFQMLDFYHEQGGNFIDTANMYQNEESEIWLGEWFEKTGRRDEFVIATKYTSSYKMGTSKPGALQVNFTGNSRKSMHMSVEASLKKLKTDYIDLLYVHWWDHTTPVEEVMQGLNALVLSGKVLYLGISDSPAWVVAKANQYARDHGLAQFVVYQGKWSIGNREMERDIIPMCKAEGMGLAPWNVLGGGMFKTDDELVKIKEGESARKARDPKAYEKNRAIVAALQKMATKKNSTVTGIALAYVYAKEPYVFPILGGRKVEHLQGNIDALTKVSLSPEEIKELEEANPIDLGFPHDMIGLDPASCMPLSRSAKYDWVETPRPIQYKQ